VSSEPLPKPSFLGAVFLSYASDDVEAAERIATALRAAEIEVWFDREELRGGDAWDQKIRQQIHDCRLFVPIISANTEARLEGYFRREWKLAVDRTESMASEVAFLFPVVIDSTPNTSAHVPEKFRHVQWTRLAGGQLAPAFVDRVRRLLLPEALAPQAATLVRRGTSPAPISAAPARRPWGANAQSWLIGAALALTLAYIVSDKVWISRRSTPPAAPRAPAGQQTAPSPAAAAAPAATAFAPPPHSIAVLPFVNMSGDKEQEYFSDGLSEELLNDLSRINELHVAARTSAFSFKGKDTDIGTIARKLNVGSVLEGSVRRSKNTVRVTAQLIDTATGFHLWSQTYDRNLDDLLKLQTDIAEAVASALKVKLLGDAATEMKVGGTRNPAAYDLYLRSASAYWQVVSASESESVRAGYQEAVRLDPNFALAYAELSIALSAYAGYFAHGPAVGDFYRQARAPARKAVELAPDLAEGHLALFIVHRTSLDFARAKEEIERALALAPGSARLLRTYGAFAVSMGRTDAGIAAARRAAALDPLSVNSYGFLSDALRFARRYDEALAAYQDGLSLRPKDPMWMAGTGHLISNALAYYALGDFEKMRAACEGAGEAVEDLKCLALAYHKLGRQADAETALARLNALEGSAAAYDYATIYAQWGNMPKALEWLETALQLREPELINLKTEPLLDPLRQEPRFKAIERELKFPP
jgi:TolB-like protein